ncbi:MAG: hypothetical protein J6L69_08685, partial [Lachnospiraceae bacterium]|nr:hypothetical protein [Lachnospiraceae bacterium]
MTALNVLYEDDDIIVCVKPAGISSQTERGFDPDMVSQICNYLAIPNPYVGVIHRLDKPVSGVMVYAKTKKAAAILICTLFAGQNPVRRVIFMRYSYEFKKECVQLYREGKWPETPPGVKEH